MRKYKNIINILAIVFVLIFLGSMFAYAEGPTVLRFKINPEDNPTVKLWTSLKHATKDTEHPVYDPTGKIDPFQNPFEVAVKEEKVEEPEPIDVPDTMLTRWDHSQLKLTGIIINGTFRFAAFTTPEGGRCYKGMIGDHVGKEGFKISAIESGYVEVRVEDRVHYYKTM